MTNDLFIQELEDLVNKSITGDITPVIFGLLKSSDSLEDLLVFLGEDVIRKEEQSVSVPDSATDFESWFSQFKTI